MLSVSAQAYIYFPGGIGTINEFFELLELVQTKKSQPIPMVLVGRDFWEGMFAWMRKEMGDRHYIEITDMDYFKVVDTAEEAFNLIKDTKEREYLT
jgi:hypothetical protein